MPAESRSPSQTPPGRGCSGAGGSRDPAATPNLQRDMRGLGGAARRSPCAGGGLHFPHLRSPPRPPAEGGERSAAARSVRSFLAQPFQPCPRLLSLTLLSCFAFSWVNYCNYIFLVKRGVGGWEGVEVQKTKHTGGKE